MSIQIHDYEPTSAMVVDFAIVVQRSAMVSIPDEADEMVIFRISHQAKTEI